MARSRKSRSRAVQSGANISLPEPRAVAVPPSNRSTFRVAQAQRALVEALPSVVPNSTRGRAKSSVRRAASPAPLSAAGAGQQSQRISSRRAAPEKAAPRSQLTMDQPRACKPRPDGTKSKGGSGPSRSYVQWCK